MAITSYNGNPYYDDINTIDSSGLTPLDKNYLRVLFRPGRTLQARELNQLQSILQTQVDRLGQSLFKANSPIVGAECSFESNLYYLDCSSAEISIFDNISASPADATLTQGVIVASIKKVENLTGSNRRIYFQYRSGNATFSAGTLTLSNSTTLSTEVTLTSTGKAVAATINDGIFFTKGCVIGAQTQYVAQPLNSGSETFNGFVALEVTENLVTSVNDITLLDNANGSLNYAGIGADRYQIVLTLTLVQGDALPDGADYIQLLKVKNSIVFREENGIDASGSTLEKILSQRTYEESGDYTVKEFDVENQEIIGDTYQSRYTDEGDITAFGIQSGTEDSKFVATLTSGIAYVGGTRVENSGPDTIVGDKGRTLFSEVNSSQLYSTSITADLGTYVEGTFATSSGLPYFDNSAITYNLKEGGSTIGECKIQSIEGLGAGTYRLYIYDIIISNTAKTFTDVTSITGSTNVNYGALNFTISSVSGKKLQDTNIQSSLFRWPQSAIKTVSELRVTEKVGLGPITVSGGTATFAAPGKTFDKSLNNIIVYKIGITEDGIIDSWTVLSGEDGDTLTISGLSAYNGDSVSIIASVTSDVTAIRGKKTLTTENVAISATPANTIISLSGVYHLISVNNDPRFEIIHDGQYPNEYRTAKIKALVEIVGPINLSVTHWKFSGGNYYTTNSYVNTSDTQVEIGDIPFYDGERLCDYLDARQVAGSSDRLALDPYSPITADLDFYLPRRDKLILNKGGELSFKKGESNLSPLLPKTPDDTISLFEYFIPAYTFNINDIIVTKVDNRRYTMRDIGRIEKRVGALEYYTSLSLLEKNVNDKSIFDDDGTARFKNGFVTDGFRNYITSDITNTQYRCSLDKERGKLYPHHEGYSVKFKPSGSQNGLSITRSDVTLAYTEVEIDEFRQDQATQFISVQPHEVVASSGLLQLYPEVDTWSDRTTPPPRTIELFPGLTETLSEIASAAGLVGTDWDRTWTNTSRVREGRRVITTQTLTGEQTSIVADDINSALGQYISDVSIKPYMRSRSIRFRASGLKANTKYYVYFDGINVTSYARPASGELSDFDPNADDGLDEATLLSKYTVGDIISNSDGIANGIFIVPNNESTKFSSGEKTLRLTNSPNNIDDETTSLADARFISNGLGVTRSETIISTSVPRIKVETVTRTRQRIRRKDPVAQTFRITDETGLFVTSVDLYFAGKPTEDNKVGVQVYLVTTINGYPTSEVVPGSETSLTWEDVIASETSSTPTRFNFDSPIYLNPDTEYALVVFSESPEYTIYIAEMGGSKRDLVTNSLINSQPALGVLFTSSNKTTWSAWQNRDLKFKMRRADFTTSPATLTCSPIVGSGISEISSLTMTTGANAGWITGDTTTTITIASPIDAITAEAEPIYDPNTLAVIGFNITKSGSGYTSAPTVTITDGVRTGIATATLAGYTVSALNLNVKDISISGKTTSSIKLKLGDLGYSITSGTPFEDVKNLNHIIDASSIPNTTLTFSLSTSDSRVSPKIDLDSLSLQTREYDLVDSKYFSKEIHLTNPSDQLDLYLDVNRPTVGSNLAVYVQFRDGNGDTIGEDDYTPMSASQPATVPINSDRDVYAEVRYSINPPDDFSSFKIRIDFIGSNAIDVCTVKDLRAIATI